MKWSPTKEALDCWTNSPYLLLLIENGVEKMHTDVSVLRVNTSELFYMVSKVILDCIGPRNFDLWLVQRAFWTNQMQNYSQSRPGGKRFPALDAGCVFQPCVLVIGLGKFLSALIGYCDYGSKTLTRKRSADNTFEFSSQAFPQIISFENSSKP